MLQNKSFEGSTQGSRLTSTTRIWPAKGAPKDLGGFTQGSRVTSAWPTRCCCEHTHVCFREPCRSRLHPRIKGYMGLADKCCEHTHVCGRILSTESLHPRVEVLHRFGRPRAAAEHTHRVSQLRVAPKYQGVNGYRVWPTSC